MNAIEVHHIQKIFDGGETVIKDVVLNVPKGSITVLIGFSGTGKSVLLKMIMGLLRPTSGEIFVLGRSLTKMEDSELIKFRQNFGVLFQNAALFDDMTTLENVCFPLSEHRRDLTKVEREKIAKERLQVVGLKEKDYNKYPSQLSGGMRKRVGLARAIALDPEILFYDEPTTGLDPIMTEMVDNLIVETHRHREGLTSLVVTHDLFAAFRIGDYVAMLHEGKILLFGTPKDFLETDIEFVRRFVSKGVRR